MCVCVWKVVWEVLKLTSELMTKYSNIYISSKMQHYTVYFIWKLHVSGGTSTHHQELKQLYLQHLLFATPLVLSAAIVEELEPV